MPTWKATLLLTVKSVAPSLLTLSRRYDFITCTDVVKDAIKHAETDQWIRRIWRKDATLWKDDEAHQKIISNALGWVTVVDQLVEHAGELAAFSERVRNDGFTHAMLLGMGGSSLCPEVFRRTFGRRDGFPDTGIGRRRPQL